MTTLVRTISPAVGLFTLLRARLNSAWAMPLPLRDTVLLGVVTFVLLIDWYHDLFSGTALLTGLAIDRAVLNLLIPLAALLLLGERPSAYGLTLGRWRLGVPLMLLGCLAMTPIIWWFGSLPDAAAYYGARAYDDPLRLVLSTYADVGTAEFLFRGVLMGVLVRRCGPLGVVIATFPFVFMHLGKPEIETLSCFFGGIGFGWLAYRSGSIVYGGLLHTYILSLVLLINV